METLDIKNKLDDEIYVSVKKFCDIKNISYLTFYRKRLNKEIPYKIVKLKGYGKRLFILINKDDIIFINKNSNPLIIVKNETNS